MDRLWPLSTPACATEAQLTLPTVNHNTPQGAKTLELWVKSDAGWPALNLALGDGSGRGCSEVPLSSLQHYAQQGAWTKVAVNLGKVRLTIALVMWLLAGKGGGGCRCPRCSTARLCQVKLQKVGSKMPSGCSPRDRLILPCPAVRWRLQQLRRLWGHGPGCPLSAGDQGAQRRWQPGVCAMAEVVCAG